MKWNECQEKVFVPCRYFSDQQLWYNKNPKHNIKSGMNEYLGSEHFFMAQVIKAMFTRDSHFVVVLAF